MLRPFVRFRFTVDKGSAYRKVLQGYVKNLRDLSWAWLGVGEGIAAWHARVFDSEGAANIEGGEQPWAPLAELTVQARLQHARVSRTPPNDYIAPSGEGPESRILHWSSRLRTAATAAGEGANRVRRGSRTSYEWGVEGVRHWVLLHAGGTNEMGKPLPARPFIDPQGGAAVAVGALEIMLRNRMKGAMV